MKFRNRRNCWAFIWILPLACLDDLCAQDAGQDPFELDRVVVTGSNIPSESPPWVPESIFSRKDVERSGADSLGDYFRTLPQNSGPTFTENQNDSLAPGGAAVALRGLSPDATLVLVNGRRLAQYPFAQSGVTSFVDLNSIPIAAIRQVDILRDGASPIYGSDAIAGVVNVRYLEKFEGALIETRYGNTTDTDTGEFSATAITGWTDEAKGIEAVVVLDYFKRNALFHTDRYFSESTDQTRQGGSSFLSSVSNPGTIFDPVTNEPLKVPADSDGHPSVGDFTPGRNRFDRAPFEPLVPETERGGVLGHIKGRVAENVDLFAEFGYRHVYTRQELAPAPIEGDVEGISAPAANPFNPFGTDVVFRYRVTEAGPRIDKIESDAYRAVAGVTVRLPGSWVGEAAFLFSETDAEDATDNNLSRSAVIDALADTNPATSFNVFGAGNNINNPSTIQSLLVTTTRTGVSRIFGGDLKFDGPLFDLPGGKVAGAVGGEYRHEELSDHFDPFATSGGVIDLNSTSANGERDVVGAFAELYVPIVSQEMGVPAISRLEAQVALRIDNYSDFGTDVNPKIGLAWHPIPDWLLIRGAFSTGFRAPSLVQSSTGSLTFSQDLQDTTRFRVTGAPEDESSSVQILSGGNPNLDPEESRSYSAGFVVTPPEVQGLSLSVDFFQIRIDNSVASLDPQFVLDNEGDFPGLVQRAPPSASDIAQGIPGPVLFVNTQFQNLGFVQVRGADFEAEYATSATPVGTFTFRLDVAYIGSFEQQSSDIEPVRELAGDYLRPRVRGRAQVGWGIGGFQALATFNYTDSYRDATGDRTVDYSTTVDFLVEYRFQKAAPPPAPVESKEVAPPPPPPSRWSRANAWLDGFAVQVGVNNIFDDAPPFANNAAGYPVGLEDPRQRFVFVGIEKRF